eukprot:CAMPEP_0179372174 /NCGR_PEP_ID=MMETSP0797-20121207/86123_1 /TAXON_ID=47934 /ORGANISM="Dinophysis acuminata, Strain DAEP01" /LENGTH=92 /DNA_ID=CAMNT_0021088085 /DNA_START=384 /DNA_END=658 /DNA_ORIENTATION=+
MRPEFALGGSTILHAHDVMAQQHSQRGLHTEFALRKIAKRHAHPLVEARRHPQVELGQVEIGGGMRSVAPAPAPQRLSRSEKYVVADSTATA